MGATNSKSQQPSHGKKAFHAAAKAGNAQLLDQLLQPLVAAVTQEMATPGAYPGAAAAALSTAVGRRDRACRTPFLVACLHGSWECAELLLESGSNILAVDYDGNGCLHLASINGHGHVVEQLLDKAQLHGIAGRLVNTCNRSGFSPLHYAAWGGHAHIVRKLLGATTASDRLLLQGCTDNYDRWLIVSQGATALHVAAQQQHAAVVLAIMQHHALRLRDWLGPMEGGSRRPVDPRTWPDAQGATPLHVALWRGLDPTSQLAALLNPRTDPTALFTLQQLDDLRRRGPPTLQVIASKALRAKLLAQLQQQQALLQEQQRAEELHAAFAKEQQQQRKLQQQQQVGQRQRQREQIWQRWWGRGSGSAAAAGFDATPATAGAVGSGGSSMYRGTHKSQHVVEGGGSSSSSSRKRVSGAEGSADGGHRAESDSSPWGGLCRTPSITLGAMQQFSTDADNSTSVSKQQVWSSNAAAAGDDTDGSRRQPGSTNSKVQQPLDVAVAALLSTRQEIHPAEKHVASGCCSTSSEMEPARSSPSGVAPAATASAAGGVGSSNIQFRAAVGGRLGSDCNSGSCEPAAAVTAAAVPVVAVDRDQCGPAGQLASASSITLGCLDRIWLATEQEQEQQQQCSSPGATHAVYDSGSSNSSGSSGGTSTGDATAVVSGTSTTVAQPHAGPTTDAAAVDCSSCAVQHHNQGSTEPSAHGLPCEVGPNEHLYKGLGGVGSFQLLLGPPGNSAHHSTTPWEAQPSTPSAAAAAFAAASAPAPSSSSAAENGGRCTPPDAAASGAAGHGSSGGSSSAALQPSSSLAVAQRPKSSAASPAKGIGCPSLASSSITLGQLASRTQQMSPGSAWRWQQQGQQSPAESAAGSAQTSHIDSSPSNTNSTSISTTSRGVPQQHLVSRPLREASRAKPKVHPLLVTAGIKSTDWDQHLTPLAWKLLQQQHLELSRSPQPQRQGAEVQPVGGSSDHDGGAVMAPLQWTQQHREVSAAAAFGEIAASNQQDQPQVLQTHQGPSHQSQQQQGIPARSPHRRSFDMPGQHAGGGFSGAFGARRQHVAHMMTQAQGRIWASAMIFLTCS